MGDGWRVEDRLLSSESSWRNAFSCTFCFHPVVFLFWALVGASELV